MKREELKGLLQQVLDLSNEFQYITYKAPELKEKMQNVKRVPKDLRDEYEDALRDIEDIENSI